MTNNKIIILFLALVLIIPLGAQVSADDDEREEKYEHYQKYEKEYEEESDSRQNIQPTTQLPTQSDLFWNIWTRSPINNPNKSLPLSAPGELKASVNNQQTKLYLVPQDGQLFVSGEAIANLLGAQSTYYPTSKILVLSKNQSELIVKVGSNAAYENRNKVPLPATVISYENTVYLPVAAAANSLHYRINWDQAQQIMIFESL